MIQRTMKIVDTHGWAKYQKIHQFLSLSRVVPDIGSVCHIFAHSMLGYAETNDLGEFFCLSEKNLGLSYKSSYA
jgi:hypothetical protein